MALLKEIQQEDGVITTYHRILDLTKTVNSHNSISVISYINEDSRSKDIICENRPYRHAVTYEFDYDGNMNIENAYDYLKSLEVFKGAKNI